MIFNFKKKFKFFIRLKRGFMKILTMMISLIAVIQLSACNTLSGVGKDVQKGGEAIEKSAD